MAPPTAVVRDETPKILPRDSPAASSPVPSTASPTKTDGQAKIPDVASLIKAAGSPEAVIQHLLKEKQSQHQQNSQLWRLVDKQRAMILGLNRDLEQALKDKEKYRKKLKDLMGNPAVLKAAGASQAESVTDGGRRGTTLPPVDVNVPKPRSGPTPESPSLDSDSQRDSPVEPAMAPYPITPPADRPQESQSAVGELLDPSHSMPKPHEHALDHFDHQAVEEAADDERKARSAGQLKEIPYNISLPPSRSLPSEPPKIPLPMPPTAAPGPTPPSVAVLNNSSSEDGVAKVLSPTLRKQPPAPLRLKQHPSRDAAALEDDESESEFDHILDVEGVTTDETRGRRRTREDDDRERTASSVKEADQRSLSKTSKSSGGKATPVAEDEPQPPAPPSDPPASAGGSLRASNNAGPLLSPGLPTSPRPLSKAGNLSPGVAPSPLSPRPPRQPIPLPPNVAMAPSPVTATTLVASSAPLPDTAKPVSELSPPSDPAERRGSSAERTEVYKGLMTDEFPDLLLPPNALLSIQIKVASSRMKPSRASLLSLTQLDEDPVFTLAIVSRADRGELWRVEKDIASFGKLDQRLKQCSSFTTKTPERSLFSGHAPAKLDARRVALEQYMDELLDTPLDTPTAVELCKYLSTNTLPPNADETGSAVKGAAENSGHTVGSDGRPVRSGYLTKKGKNFGGWKARFFVVEGPYLKYYETPGGTHLGTIKLQNAQIGRQSQHNESQPAAAAAAASTGGAASDDLDNHYRHAFLILEPKKKDSTSHVKHVLCAESDRERDLWVDVLLQWIDQRDPDDAEAPTSKADRHVSVPEYPAGTKTRRGNPARSSHQPGDSGTLIGVRYDSTQAGDTPQGAPGSGKPDHHAGHLSMAVETMSSQAYRAISGPKDPQVIADSSAWGNRSGLGLPSNDEKKQRKRSFFGFGPKTRSSSDGQDSIFGGSDMGPPSAGMPAAPGGHGSYQGPARQVFGAPLAEAVRFSPPSDVNVPLPSVVFRCIEYLASKNGTTEEGIFRLSGSNVVIKQLRERFNTENDVNLLTDEQYYDIHAVASLLKLYLRELPTMILTRDLQREFLATTEMTDRQEKIAALSELAKRLPRANATLLKYLISFLIKIINNASVNKMNARNVGIVFSPTLNIPAPVFALFLQHYEGIFGIDPERYELPSAAEAERPRTTRPLDGRDMSPRRPSPASSASPQRQTRPDIRREAPRSTPTPPLTHASRGSLTPTPPLTASRPKTYEPSWRPQHESLRQPSLETVASAPLRPAYESCYGLPTGPELYNLMQQPQRPTPGYDRHKFVAGPSERRGSGSQSPDPSTRRESTVYMGVPSGLQSQGSKSRLREESRF
ncbi:hypothetical protein L249_3389 [Ophiocordyceps polyrhachis-furcata BCC 54312]|uniref:RhoGAP domain-containing protein n=1 Tax=Ophiocordyceps polyrhachis-furcata BCC 54312 TaxID=1330021 RepID=A0A367LM07_9HYPO|nr:hypothetical protein L249_3389 [Ophiocordyceps polyrhachis-furcata BCC 54312]